MVRKSTELKGITKSPANAGLFLDKKMAYYSIGQNKKNSIMIPTLAQEQERKREKSKTDFEVMAEFCDEFTESELVLAGDEILDLAGLPIRQNFRKWYWIGKTTLLAKNNVIGCYSIYKPEILNDGSTEYCARLRLFKELFRVLSNGKHIAKMSREYKLYLNEDEHFMHLVANDDTISAKLNDTIKTIVQTISELDFGE